MPDTELIESLKRRRDEAAAPAIRLENAGPDDVVVGHLGGAPLLPAGTPWPSGPHREPLSHLLSVDLSALPENGLGLPASGWLQFFRTENVDHGEVRYVPAGTPTETGTPPAPLPHIAITAVVTPTLPGFAHRIVRGELDQYLDLPWIKVASTLSEGTVHQLGGYGEAVQGEAEYAPDLAPMLVPRDGDPSVAEELPVLLAQIDTDDEAGIGWGDCGNSHWIIGRDDLAAGRFDKVRMVWSCF